MPENASWPAARRFAVVAGVVALLVVVVVWNRPSPDPAPAATPTLDYDPLEPHAEAVLFGQVLSVHDAVVRDGLWYLLDTSGRQVHRLDPATGSVRTFGRRGEGPGEFQGMPGGIVVHGDSIVIYGYRTLHIFGAEG